MMDVGCLEDIFGDRSTPRNPPPKIMIGVFIQCLFCDSRTSVFGEMILGHIYMRIMRNWENIGRNEPRRCSCIDGRIFSEQRSRLVGFVSRARELRIRFPRPFSFPLGRTGVYRWIGRCGASSFKVIHPPWKKLLAVPGWEFPSALTTYLAPYLTCI